MDKTYCRIKFCKSNSVLVGHHTGTVLVFKLPNSCHQKMLVGLGRVELPTSRLSGVRSNQLSYRPNEFTWYSANLLPASAR